VGTAILQDDDTAPTVSINSPAAVTEGTAVSFSISLSVVSGLPVTVNYTSTNGTAGAGSDYTAVTSSVTIPAGATGASVSVTTTNDSLDENAETFTLTLSSPTNATLGTSVATATLQDDDTAPTVSINSPVAVVEGNTVGFTISLSAVSGLPVNVSWGTSGMTALGANDYSPVNGTVTIPAGSLNTTVNVATINDTLDENDGEQFLVVLSNPINAMFATAIGTATINDNDTAAITINDVTGNEGDNFTFTVSLSTPSVNTITVNYSTANGTALAGSDYTAGTGTLTFTAGQTTRTIIVTGVEDLVDEVDENYTISLSSATNAAISDPTANATIADDDGIPAFTINDVTATE
jgi:Calx-beta domain